MKQRRILIFLSAIILLANTPIFSFLMQDSFTYSNRDGSFRYIEEKEKGLSYRSCLINYGAFLCKHPEKDQGDNRLYRTFTIKPWRFWEWSNMLFSDRYKLPYKQPG